MPTKNGFGQVNPSVLFAIIHHDKKVGEVSISWKKDRIEEKTTRSPAIIKFEFFELKKKSLLTI